MKNSQVSKGQVSTGFSAHLSEGTGAEGRPVPTLWRAILGFVIWSAGFVVLYVVHALACRYVGIPPGTIDPAAAATTLTVVLTVIWLGFVALIAWLARKSWQLKVATPANHEARKLVRFMPTVTFTVDVVSAISMFVTGLPILLTPACM